MSLPSEQRPPSCQVHAHVRPSAEPHSTWTLAFPVGRIPVVPQNQERDVVRDQERRNPERRDPIRRSHVRRDSIDVGENDCRKEIDGALHIEGKHEDACGTGASDDGGNRNDCQDGREQVAERRRSRELQRHAWISRPWRKEHEAEVAKPMKKEDGQKHRLRSQFLEPWKNIDPCANPEDERAEQQVRREYVHDWLQPRPDLPNATLQARWTSTACSLSAARPVAPTLACKRMLGTILLTIRGDYLPRSVEN